MAVKIEPIHCKNPQLLFEASLLQHLHLDSPKPGLPQVYQVTTERGYHMMGMELLGSSLHYYFTHMRQHFHLGTVLAIGLQLLDRIEMLHEAGFVHRDIKPDNMLMGGTHPRTVYLIDVGLAKRYAGEDGHIPPRRGLQLVGTLRYASAGSHKGMEQSRRDDIESIGYVLVYFLAGRLPWQGLQAGNLQAKLQLIKNKKVSTPVETLCKGQPYQLAKLIQYAKNLKFEEKPDYEYLRCLLRQAAENRGLQLGDQFGWSQPENPEETHPLS